MVIKEQYFGNTKVVIDDDYISKNEDINKRREDELNEVLRYIYERNQKRNDTP